MEDDSNGSGTFQVGWPLVAGAASLVAVSSVAALILVIAIRQADILSATALSLAILAFVLQLVVFIAQTWTSSQQSLHSQMLNTETRLLLTEVRSSAQGIERMMTSQFERLLDHILSWIPRELDAMSAKTDGASMSNGDLNETLRTLRDRLHTHWQDEIDQVLNSPAETDGPAPAPSPTPEANAQIAALQSYPGETEGRDSLGRLRKLRPEAVAMLRRYANDEIRSLGRGEAPGLRGSDSTEAYRRELVDAGLLRRHDTLPDHYQLTDAGREAARLLVAKGDPPSYLAAAGNELASVDHSHR